VLGVARDLLMAFTFMSYLRFFFVCWGTQQLQSMGFTNASQNVRALLATGGNVNSAVEYILSGGGL
jgi:hypothetical protein